MAKLAAEEEARLAAEKLAIEAEKAAAKPKPWRHEHSQLPHEAMARKGRAAPTLAMVRNGFLPPGEQPRNTRQGIDRNASTALAHARAEMAR
ncbi:MAG: hypothetical protein AB7U95_25115 [Reyranella sp.]